jgi:hypothetical protein
VRELKCSRLAWNSLGGWEGNSGGNSFMLSFGGGWRGGNGKLSW